MTTEQKPRLNADMESARLHLLAEIHAEQQVQTEWLHRIRDLLAVMAEPKGTHDRIGSRCTQVGCLELHDPEPGGERVSKLNQAKARKQLARGSLVARSGYYTNGGIVWFDEAQRLTPEEGTK